MFGKLDCVTKMKLFKAYCCSFYGCELWDLSNIAVQTLCATWRKALRHVCNLPPTCHTEIVNLLNKNVSLFDDICKRSLKFIQSCLTSDNRVVNFIARHGVVGCWRGYLSGASCRLAYGPADATATHCLLLQ